MMRRLLFILLISGCTVARDIGPVGLYYTPFVGSEFNIAAWSRITDNDGPVHVYIEGDGRSFDAFGAPTRNPTPCERTVRDMAAKDMSPNVVYIARPCQFVSSPTCTVHDWTDGRFSSRAVDAVAAAARNIVGNRPVVLIGYSGGAMISGLIIQNHPEINVEKWITVAGVLNHADWTNYFGDSPLTHSLNLDKLPHISATHYVAERDAVVPIELSKKWTGGAVTVIPDSTHTKIDANKIVL